MLICMYKFFLFVYIDKIFFFKFYFREKNKLFFFKDEYFYGILIVLRIKK